MAVGKLIVSPETIRGFPSAGYEDSKLFVGCFIRESEKHRTHSVNGPEPFWKNSLDVTVPEGENYLNIELVNESPNNGGIVATAKVALNQVYSQGNESKWIQLNSNQGRSYGELKLNLTFNGTSSVSSVTSSFGDMNLAGGQHASYQQTTTHSYSTSHSQSDSRQSSFSSLGPSNPIPQNYGSGAPPPFTPPAAVSYPEKSGNNSMPGSNNSYVGTPTAGGLVGADGVVNPDTMSKGEFEEAKARGTIPTWAKYGGGALAGAAALGLAAWGTHELKEHFDEKKKKEEEEKKHSSDKKDEKPFVPPSGYLQQQQPQQPYTIHNQQHNQDHQSKQYPAPPQQHYSSDNKGDQHKKDKKDKKEKKKSKKHGGSGSDSSSSDSDSSDDERKGKKHDKHHKRRDNEWH
ncbi:hypothetical protein HMPREF1544_03549 [Mucor circinelloides 1006PhL]|uniref:C2 domain-containing protein n=1 Tax=Mucor circinelloides f. circinelloides (strain 1006PhL) TaxID=1220926 RepID=S2JM67_MUCC1|nr:hypothetical protein HMPREF1544_03549 [Mucor circinelloides 1006PhL]